MSSPRGARAPLFVGLVVVAFALAALPALPALPLVRASQARAWSVARTMVTSGDWVLPRYQGETRLKKPPLQSWAQAATMEAAGSTDLRWAGAASWLVGVLFALGPLALGAALGRPIAGLLGSLLLATTRASMLWGTSPEHDVPFAGFVAFSLAALARALGPSGRPWHAWAAGLLGGAAVLVKGPFALAFVGGTALVAARGRREAPLSGPALVLPLVVGLLAPAGLWLLAVLGRLGALDAVADEILRQASGSEGAHVRRGVGYVVYYLGMIPKWSMPWTAFLAVALFALWRGRGEARRGSEGPSLRFGVLAFAVIALVLTAAPAKQEHYLLSALPPAFLLVGGVLEAIAARLGPRAWILPALLALGGAALAASRVVPAARLDPHVPLFVDLGFLGVVVLVALGLGRRLEGTRGLVAGLLLAALAVGLGARRSSLFDRADGDLREDARALHAAWPPGPSLVGFAPGRGEAFDVLVAWIPRPYERVRTAQELAARLDRGDAPLVLVREPQLGALGPTAARLRAVRVIAPPHGADAKDRVQVFVPK